MTEAVVLQVNGVGHEISVEPRELLLDALRGPLGQTSVHAGCEQGACGACTVLLDGEAVRSCLMFAVQAGGATITTVEGLARDGNLHPLQEAFSECHALQCGFCTPAMVLAALELLQRDQDPSPDEVEDALAGQICRCTGYTSIVDAVTRAGAQMREQEASP